MGATCSNPNLTPEEIQQLKEERKQHDRIEKLLSQEKERVDDDPLPGGVLVFSSDSAAIEELFIACKRSYNLKALEPIEDDIDVRRTQLELLRSALTSVLTLFHEQACWGNETRLSEEMNMRGEELSRLLDAVKNNEVLQVNYEHIDMVQMFWLDEGVQALYSYNPLFSTPLPVHTRFLIDNLASIMDPEVIRIASTTADRRYFIPRGLIQTDLVIENVHISLMDTSYVRGSSKILPTTIANMFSSVLLLVFIVPYTDYAKYELEKVELKATGDAPMPRKFNAMDRALETMVDQVRIYEQSAKKSISVLVLFQRGGDALNEKLKRVPLTFWDPNYVGRKSASSAEKHIHNRFFKAFTEAKDSQYSSSFCMEQVESLAEAPQYVYNAMADLRIYKYLERFRMVQPLPAVPLRASAMGPAAAGERLAAARRANRT